MFLNKCFFGHRFSKWREISPLNLKSCEIITKQKRICETCGSIEYKNEVIKASIR